MTISNSKDQAKLILEKAKTTGSESKAPTGTISDFESLLKTMRPKISAAVPKHLTPERILRVAQTAFSTNEKLQQCEKMTVISAIILGAQMGLEVNTPLGHAYLIPYYNKKTGRMEAQFQTGYKGHLALAYRTNLYRCISAECVYEEDYFEYEFGLDRKLRHVPAKTRDSEDPVYYYGFYQTITGGDGFVVWSRDQVLKHAKKYSQSWNADKQYFMGPWKTDFDSMAKKTVLQDLLKYAPKSIEIERFLSQDGSVKEDIQPDMMDVINLNDLAS